MSLRADPVLTLSMSYYFFPLPNDPLPFLVNNAISLSFSHATTFPSHPLPNTTLTLNIPWIFLLPPAILRYPPPLGS